ncbi:MAG TPA: outer membrane beta-barrel protein [Steroidobacteraceae bacterium]|nr:outer membrane beta-barrel protein [Steroidobacteraceae bacterium]
MALLWAGGIQAQERDFAYFGMGGGIAKMDLGSKSSFDAVALARFGPPAGSSLDDSTDAWGLQVGYRFNRYVAAEVGYVDLGRGSYVANYPPSSRYSVRFLSSGPTLAVLGMFPVAARFDIHGRVGLFLSDTRVRDRVEDRSTGAFQSVEPKGRDPDLTLGLGAAWNINESYSVRLELTRFMDVGKESQIPEQFDIDSLQFSVLFR